ncbi:MAG: glycosyltransferase family 39 protein [Anaerolineales bacterium]
MGQKPLTPALVFTLILLLGIFARVWQYGTLPPGLNQDEASIGVEAYDLLHFGVDRNGQSFPVNFISWGNGMDALYGYVLIPFVFFGLSPMSVRLPSLLAGVLTLPLIYWIGKRSFGRKFGLLAMFLLAISPWHILMSRWGINENILPFILALGFACLLRSTRENHWFIAAVIFFGLSLYAYGATYVAVPILLACTIPVLLISGRLRLNTLLLGIGIYALLAVPIVLLVLINSFDWTTIRLSIFTIPRLPVKARFLTVATTSNTNPFVFIVRNAWSMLKLLLFDQSDGMLWNVVDPFGYLYSFSFPLAVVGAALLLPLRKTKNIPEKLLVLAWLLSSLSIGLVQSVNINRLNLAFLPIILCTAFCLAWLGSQRKIVLTSLMSIYLFSFLAFNYTYHGINYQSNANEAFFAGLVPALDHARQTDNQPICVTDQVNMPYIFVLFSEKPNPATYLDTIQYIDPAASFRQVRSLGRYTFGLANCSADPRTIYVLEDEKPPSNGIHYIETNFTQFHVYTP